MINTIKNAIAKRREELAENDKGFTLIELLVVVLIIGILAAIAIPAFLSQREGAWVSQVESDLKNAAIAAETYSVTNNGSYAGLEATASTNGAAAGEWDANGFNGTEGVNVAATVTATTFVLTGTNTNLGTRTFTYDSATGVIVDSQNP